VVIGYHFGEYLVDCDTVLSGHLLQHNNIASSSASAEAGSVLPVRTVDDMVEDNS
jgi:hypothetical protein